MPWNDQSNGPNRPSGGPWGDGPRQPWGQGPKGRETPPGGQTPDLEEMMKRFQDRMRGGVRRGGRGGGGDEGPRMASTGGLAVLGALLVAGWFASGVYVVDAGEAGVVTRFGVYDRTSSPGLHVHLPWPVETVQVEPVTLQRQIDVGFRDGRSAENLMLTQDQGIVSINFAVQYSLSDVEDFVFNVRDPEDLVQAVADSAIREVVGQRSLDAVITRDQAAVADATRDLMQRMLDSYRAGVQVNQFNMRATAPQAVSEAFADVVRANSDRETRINQANRYANEVIPQARGQAQKLIQDAEAYREQTVRDATGEAERFRLIQEQYRQNPRVTRDRLYLETMERVFGGADKIIIDQRSGVTPLLPLDQLRRPGAPAAAAPAQPSQPGVR